MLCLPEGLVTVLRNILTIYVCFDRIKGTGCCGFLVMTNYFVYFARSFALNVIIGIVSPFLALYRFNKFLSKRFGEEKLYEFFKNFAFQIPSAMHGQHKKNKSIAFLCRFLSFLCLIPLYLACAVCAVVFIAVAIPVGLIAAVVAFVACLFIGVPILLISSAYRLATGKGFEVNDRGFSICSVAFPRESSGIGNGSEEVVPRKSSSEPDVLFYILIGSAFVAMLPVIVLCALIIALPTIFYIVACKLENWIVNRNVPDDVWVTDYRNVSVPSAIVVNIPTVAPFVGMLADPFTYHGHRKLQCIGLTGADSGLVPGSFRDGCSSFIYEYS